MSKSNSKQLHKRIRTATRAEPEEQPIEEQPTEPRVIEVAPLTVVQNSPNEEAELVFTDEPTFRLRKRKASSLQTTSTTTEETHRPLDPAKREQILQKHREVLARREAVHQAEIEKLRNELKTANELRYIAQLMAPAPLPIPAPLPLSASVPQPSMPPVQSPLSTPIPRRVRRPTTQEPKTPGRSRTPRRDLIKGGTRPGGEALCFYG